jgi:hypothetical protein
MNTIAEGEDAVRRAGWIASHSRIAAIAAFVVRRAVASVRSSWTRVFARRYLREFQSLPSGERTLCALIASTAALAGHILLAAILPASASPTLALTTVALLGIGLAAGASAK